MDTVSRGKPYLRRADRESSHWYMGALFSMLAQGSDSDGSIGLMEVVARQGGEPPLHTHTREDEAFYVLEGRLTFRAGGEHFDAEPGAFVFLPRNVPHGFAVMSETARMLALVAPAGVDRYFVETGRPAPSFSLPPIATEPPDVEAMVRDLARYGVSVVGPPLRQLMQAASTQ